MPTLRIDGLEHVLAQLVAAPRIIEEELDDAESTVLGDMTRAIATYPPAPAGSKYVRTGRYGEGWKGAPQKVIVQGAGISLAASNPVSYAGYVGGGAQDSPHQAWQDKRAGWLTTDTVAKQYEGEATKAAETALERAARRIES